VTYRGEHRDVKETVHSLNLSAKMSTDRQPLGVSYHLKKQREKTTCVSRGE